MRTLLDLERISTGKWRLRVRREDPKGNCSATASIEADAEKITAIASNSIKSWASADESQARATKTGRRGR